MSGGGGGDPNAEKNSMNLLWFVLGIFFIAIVVWYFLGFYIRWGFLSLKWYEAKLIDMLGGDVSQVMYLLQALEPDDLTWEMAQFISEDIAWFYVWPALGTVLLLSLLLWKGHVFLQFTKAYSMKTLSQQEAETWPAIAPVVNLDLLKEDIFKGPWAMAMSPMQFGKKYKLLDVVLAPSKTPWKNEPNWQMTLNRERTKQVFWVQLGSPWQGVKHLPPHAKALFAVFAARMNHDTEPARDLLAQMASSYAKGHINYTGANELLAKHWRSKAVQKVVQRHAYVNTLMASMLLLSRADGVQASADFLWLKVIDRRLWYTLSSVGRQTCFCEVAGVFAHWRVETELLKPLKAPHIDKAIDALEEALGKILYQPTDDEESLLIKRHNGDISPEEFKKASELSIQDIVGDK